MKVLNDYGSHHYFHNYSFEDDIHCPKCTKLGIWVESEGDFYCGSGHVCVNCGFIFTMPTSHFANERELKIIEQLKSGVTFKPTNPKGA